MDEGGLEKEAKAVNASKYEELLYTRLSPGIAEIMPVSEIVFLKNREGPKAMNFARTAVLEAYKAAVYLGTAAAVAHYLLQ